EWTSVSNIGVYFTAIAAAQAMGYVGSDEAHARLDRAIGSLENLKTWHGFQQSWNSVKTLAPAEHDPWVSILDSGNLAAGLIVVRQAYPRFRDRCDKLLGAMDWGAFYDSDTGLLCGGFNTATGQ